MIKKYVKTSVLVFILLLVFMPYLIGVAFKHQYEKDLQVLSKNLKLNLVLIEYQRGWFQSNATLAVNFPLADKPLDIRNIRPQNALIIKQIVFHGPVVIYNNPSSHLGIKLALAYIDSYLNPNLHFASTKIAFSTALKTQLALHEYKISNNHEILYALQGLNGSISLNRNQTQLSADLSISKLISNAGTPRIISDFKLTQKLSLDNQGIWIGNKQYQFGQLNWQQGDMQLSFNKFNTLIHSEAHNDRINMHIASDAQAAIINNQNYGPQRISLSFSNLDKKELKQAEDYFPMSNSLSPTGDAINLQAHVRMLLTKGAHLNMDELALNTAWGKVDLKININCPSKNSDGSFITLLSNAKGSIKGHFPIELANTLINNFYLIQESQGNSTLANEKAKQSLAMWQQTGWLIPLGNEFFMDLQWQHNQWVSITYNITNN